MATPDLVSGSGARLQVSFFVDYDEPIDLGTVDASLPIATDSSTLHRLRAKLGVKLNSSTGIIRVGIIGDSWTDRVAIPQNLKDMLTAAYGTSGYGWISVDSDDSAVRLTGLTHTNANWTEYDASEDGAPDPTIGCAVDGKAIYTSGTTATVSISVVCESFKIAYRDGDGTFRYRVDGGSYTSVAGAESGNVEWVDITGLSDASHTIEIDTTVNTGEAVIYGYVARHTDPGIEFHKLGNGSIDGDQIETYLDQMQPFFEELELDAIIVALGTNDYRRAKPFESYAGAITGIADAVRAEVSDCGVILWAPADSDGTAVLPLTDYVAEMYRLSGSGEIGCEFFNHHKMFGTFEEADALGMWSDSLHLNDDGAYVAVKELVRRLFWL
jgi:lysophospholipase L1-like esterase